MYTIWMVTQPQKIIYSANKWRPSVRSQCLLLGLSLLSMVVFTKGISAQNSLSIGSNVELVIDAENKQFRVFPGVMSAGRRKGQANDFTEAA